MIGSKVLLAFVGLAGVLTAQVVATQTVAPKTEKAQFFEVRGRVVDESGDSVRGVPIRVEAAGPDGPPTIRRFPIATDEHGDFSLSLGQGKYYFMSNPVAGLLDNRQEIHTDGSSGDPYGPTYYPSTVNKAAAVPVSVAGASGDTAPLVIRLLRQSARQVAASTPASRKSASVEGMVVNQVTGAPLPHVHVSLWNYDDGIHRVYGAMTHPDGTFSITGMPPISYGIVINRAGFANPRPGRTSVTLLAGEQTRDLKLPMVPSGAIAGRVLGPDGEPAEGINVYVRGRSGQLGAQTDEQGRFRISGLLPGSYRLEAPPLTWARPSKPPEFPPDGPPPTHWGAARYPGAIEVQAGSETGGIEVRLTRTPVVRVSGRVTGFTQGAAIALSVNSRFGGFTDIAKADGTFAWWNLDPGEYVIRAWQGVPSLDDWASRGERPGSPALTTITVADANVDNIALRFRPPSDISGQVGYETAEAEPHAPEKWLRLAALNLKNGGGAAILSADGHFTLNPLLPGRYKVMCDCLRPADCRHPAYVKSMWLESAQIEGDILDLSEGPASATLRVLLSSAFGAISGTVQADRAPMAGLKAALVSPRPDRAPRFGDIDVGGRYSFNSVVPGEYQLAVVDDDELLLQGAGLEQYRPVIVPVKILAGESIIRNPSIFKRQ
jgi:protocatechuate 3,4-dioxygenase beta subunit